MQKILKMQDLDTASEKKSADCTLSVLKFSVQ